MKRYVFGIALLVIMGFVAAAYGQQIVGVDTLVLTGEVRILVIDYWGDKVTRPFEGSVTVHSEPPGGAGVIANGQLSFIFGRPSTLEPLADVLADAVRGWGGFVISSSGAMGARLTLRTPEAGMTISQSSTFGGGHARESNDVHYVFVDRDVTINARRRIENTSERDDLEWIEDHRAFNITLRTGWNALHRNTEEEWHRMGREATTTLCQDIPERVRRWIHRSDGAIPFFN